MKIVFLFSYVIFGFSFWFWLLQLQYLNWAYMGHMMRDQILWKRIIIEYLETSSVPIIIISLLPNFNQSECPLKCPNLLGSDISHLHIILQFIKHLYTQHFLSPWSTLIVSRYQILKWRVRYMDFLFPFPQILILWCVTPSNFSGTIIRITDPLCVHKIWLGFQCSQLYCPAQCACL